MMKSTFELPRTKQCKGCPWKESIDPATIPNGFDYEVHQRLLDNTPEAGEFNVTELHIMSCHHSNDRDGMMCIGWLENQLGVGNNIPLRFKMRNCTNIDQIKVYGKQKKDFRDVRPKR